MIENITVAIATYNGEKYIEKQLESIFNQTKKVDRVVICDTNQQIILLILLIV